MQGNQAKKRDFKVVENLELGKHLTYLPNKSYAIYNWFHFKEAFSRDFVRWALRRFNASRKDLVLDPFCGVGTTLLACKEIGIDSIGFDVLPLAVFVSRVKLRDYEPRELREALSEITSKARKIRVPARFAPFIRKFFLKGTLIGIERLKRAISEIELVKVRDFFTLALMNASMKCSFAYKDGAVLKVRRKEHVPPITEMFKRVAKKMIRDLETTRMKKANVIVDFCDARKLRLESDSVSIVITSPPYLNKIEYIKVYELEHELFLKDYAPLPPLRSYFSVREHEAQEREPAKLKEVIESDLPLEALPYFQDMLKVLQELYRVCKSKARLAMVLSDGIAKQRVVDVLGNVAALCEFVGFKVKRIIVGNKRIATTPRRRKIGVLREGVILFEKP